VDVVDICLPEELHEEACFDALKAGKHVICEKPLALSAESCSRIMEAAGNKVLKTMCGFNYRFLPAVRLAKELIESGKIGKIYCVAASYAQESGHDPKRPGDQIRYMNGKQQLGMIRGLGSHLIDTVRYLCGEVSSVNADVRTMIPSRTALDGGAFQVSADDIAVLNIELKSGGLGSLTASALATGRKNRLALEINGSLGTICFDLENLNILSVYSEGRTLKDLRGFTHINVTENAHPLTGEWWPPAHIHGWESGHVNELCHFLDCIDKNRSVAPSGATFTDGYMAARIAEAAVESSKLGKKIYL